MEKYSSSLGYSPTFEWESELKMKLIIGYNDYNEQSDVAILSRIHSSYSSDAWEDSEDECLFNGYLQNKKDVKITVDGCPCNSTFQVRLNFFLLG